MPRYREKRRAGREAVLAFQEVLQKIVEEKPSYMLPADMEDGKLIIYADCGAPDFIICDGKTYKVIE